MEALIQTLNNHFGTLNLVKDGDLILGDTGSEYVVISLYEDTTNRVQVECFDSEESFQDNESSFNIYDLEVEL